jgi:hypothetical protein
MRFLTEGIQNEVDMVTDLPARHSLHTALNLIMDISTRLQIKADQEVIGLHMSTFSSEIESVGIPLIDLISNGIHTELNLIMDISTCLQHIVKANQEVLEVTVRMSVDPLIDIIPIEAHQNEVIMIGVTHKRESVEVDPDLPNSIQNTEIFLRYRVEIDPDLPSKMGEIKDQDAFLNRKCMLVTMFDHLNA